MCYFVIFEERLEIVCNDIEVELDERLKELEKVGKLLEV